MKDIQAVDLVTLGYGKVKADQGQNIGFRNTKGSVEAGNEVRHLVEADELCRVRVKPVKLGTSFNFEPNVRLDCILEVF